MDALTKVLVALYEEPEKPVDAMEYPFLTSSTLSMQVRTQIFILQAMLI
mgnify:CR=1 FL=1